MGNVQVVGAVLSVSRLNRVLFPSCYLARRVGKLEGYRVLPSGTGSAEENRKCSRDVCNQNSVVQLLFVLIAVVLLFL